MLPVINGIELLTPKLLDDEEFDFDLPVSPVDSEQ